ncbi:MAG: hypothetical protein GXO86_07435 [Chlorobi bacterium]|nr:hypothetical protein [Chlorobiota bacterium]
MKTKILILAALVFAGLTFSSCTKDNSLMDETSFQQSNQKTEWTPDPGGIGKDMISNTPDPFRSYTTIKYIVRKPANVSLAVYYGGGQELVAVLVNDEFQEPGLHSVKFNASGLPYGKYIAKLIIRAGGLSVVYKEEMIKSALEHQDGEITVTD